MTQAIPVSTRTIRFDCPLCGVGISHTFEIASDVITTASHFPVQWPFVHPSVNAGDAPYLIQVFIDANFAMRGTQKIAVTKEIIAELGRLMKQKGKKVRDFDPKVWNSIF